MLITEVNPTGSIDDRGGQLRERVLQALGKNGHLPSLNPEEETHITYYCPWYEWAWIAVIFYHP